MLTGLWRLLTRAFRGKATEPIASDDVYSPRERLIYSYSDGTQVVRADPLTLWKRMMEVGPELSIDMRVAHSPSKDAVKAHGSALEKIRRIFAVRSWEEGGLSQLETFELLNHFMEWVGEQKKNGSSAPTSAAATWAPSAPSSDANPPTPSSSGSISTDDGPSTSEPT